MIRLTIMVSSLDINQRKRQIAEEEGLPSSEPAGFPSELACCLCRAGRHENERSNTDHESQETLSNLISAAFILLKKYNVPQSGKANAIQNNRASLGDVTNRKPRMLHSRPRETWQSRRSLNE
jgi:hypothetical protein